MPGELQKTQLVGTQLCPAHLLPYRCQGGEVLYKAQVRSLMEYCSHQAPRPPPPLHFTHVAPYRQEQVTVPFSRTEHHLRSFLPRYGRLWNQLVRQTDLHHRASLQDFKRG
ncbi:hypothetical protein GWK47_009688 [Chionoecetes opilio]|uniref:Uncharacterized protein n=1 Tax=Chionoecetes opilio TaxID=41210 RepID=A0A8J5CPI1_CHIOP|nr:hypothetical protein GWK47_009688 [Chionoecetes opilio]